MSILTLSILLFGLLFLLLGKVFGYAANGMGRTDPNANHTALAVIVIYHGDVLFHCYRAVGA